MAKKNEIKEEGPKEVLVAPLTEEFGSGDMNVLRDKINEVITKL